MKAKFSSSICHGSMENFREFRNFLEESRKVRVSTTIAHQSLSQLPEEHRMAATGASSMIVFRVLGDESKLFARSYDATPK
jgi:hypothetical protein